MDADQFKQLLQTMQYANKNLTKQIKAATATKVAESGNIAVSSAQIVQKFNFFAPKKEKFLQYQTHFENHLWIYGAFENKGTCAQSFSVTAKQPKKTGPQHHVHFNLRSQYSVQQPATERPWLHLRSQSLLRIHSCNQFVAHLKKKGR